MSWKAAEIKRKLAQAFIREEHIELIRFSDGTLIIRISMGAQIFIDVQKDGATSWQICLFKLNKSGSRSKTFPEVARRVEAIPGNAEDVANVVRVFSEVFEVALSGPIGEAWGHTSEEVALSRANLERYREGIKRQQEAAKMAEQARQKQISSGNVFTGIMIALLVLGALSVLAL